MKRALLITLVPFMFSDAQALTTPNWPLPRKMAFNLVVAGQFHEYAFDLVNGKVDPRSFDSSVRDQGFEPDYNDILYQEIPPTGPDRYVPVNIDDSTVLSSFDGTHAHLSWHFNSKQNYPSTSDLTIDFELDTASHKVTALAYSRSSYTVSSGTHNFSFVLKDLRYDSTHLWSPSKEIRDHLTSLTCSYKYGAHNFHYGGYELQRLDNVTVAGTLSTTPSRVEFNSGHRRLAGKEQLEVRSRLHGIEVHLSPDNGATEVVVYSIIGKQVRVVPVNSFESIVKIDNLSAGLYFVTCDSQVAKVVVDGP